MNYNDIYNDIFTFADNSKPPLSINSSTAEWLRHASIICLRGRMNLEWQLKSFSKTSAKTLAIDVPEPFTYQDIQVLSESKLLSGIERIIVMKRSQKFYKAIDGILYSADGAELFLCPAAKQEAEILPGTVSIGRYAFAGCHSITSLHTPSSVRLLASYAFFAMPALEQVTIDSGLERLGYLNQYSVFASCKKLKRVQLPDSLLSISDAAFDGCESLSEISFPAHLQMIGNRAFSKTSLSKVTLPASITGLGPESFTGLCGASMVSVTFDARYHIPSGLLQAFLLAATLLAATVPNEYLVSFYDQNTGRVFYLPKVLRTRTVLFLLSDAFDSGLILTRKPTYYKDTFLPELPSVYCVIRYVVYTALAYSTDSEVLADLQPHLTAIFQQLPYSVSHLHAEIPKLCQFLQLDLVKASDLQNFLDIQRQHSEVETDTTLTAYVMDALHRAKAGGAGQDFLMLE